MSAFFSPGSCLVLADTTGWHSPDTRPTSRPIVYRHTRPTSRPTLHQVSVDSLPESRPRCRSSIGRDIGRVPAEMSADSVCRLSTDTIGRHHRSSIDQHCPSSVSGVSAEISTDISADTPPTYSTDISADTRPILDWILGRILGRHLGEISTDIWSSVGRNVLQVCRLVNCHCRSILGWYVRLHSLDTSTDILDRYFGRHLGEISTDTWLSVGRHALQVGRPWVATFGRYLFGMSVYTRPTPRPLCYDELSSA